MPSVDLNKNKDSILKAHKEVSDPNSKTNWALFGYDGQSDVLKLVSKGDGGIEELVDELSSGKIMYAYIKVIDPNSNLPKFVFVNWQGEGVPEVRKGACANHVRDVQNLLRGAHVSINARTEDDVDEKAIKARVSKASGANYGFHKEERKPLPAAEPVGSVYQKTRPQIEIKPDIKQSFWEASEREEKQRILLEKQRAAQERSKLEKEIKDREEKETKAREQRENERLKKIREIKDAESRSAASSQENQAKYNAADAARDEEERAKRSDQMRKERAAEAKALASGRTSDARSRFEQKPTSQFDQPAREPAPTKKLKHGFLPEADKPSEPQTRKQPIQLPKSDASSSAARVTPSVPPPPAKTQEVEEIYDDASNVQQKSVTSPSTGPQAKNLLAQGMPRRPPDSDEEQDEEQNWEETPEDNYRPQPTPTRVAAPAVEELYEDAGAIQQMQEEELYDDTTGVAGGQQTYEEELYDDTAGVAGGQQTHEEELYDDTTGVAGSGGDSASGVCARALYDYQAAEENEITFDPEDVITNIEMIDDGWWIGTAPDGRRGMFPSNYVELF